VPLTFDDVQGMTRPVVTDLAGMVGSTDPNVRGLLADLVLTLTAKTKRLNAAKELVGTAQVSALAPHLGTACVCKSVMRPWQTMARVAACETTLVFIQQ
jgi:hypothetical protein